MLKKNQRKELVTDLHTALNDAIGEIFDEFNAESTWMDFFERPGTGYVPEREYERLKKKYRLLPILIQELFYQAVDAGDIQGSASEHENNDVEPKWEKKLRPLLADGDAISFSGGKLIVEFELADK